MMNCHEIRQLLHAYVDGELELLKQIDVENHLAGCAECAKSVEGLKSLRSAVTTQAPYFRMPRDLRDRLGMPPTASPAKTRATRARSYAAAASVLMLMGLTMFSWKSMSDVAEADQRLVQTVIAGHIRSMQVQHAVDVVSEDRHTVKPWFRGHLDYAPQVIELSDQGFKLAGGRLDYLLDRSVAAIVYHRRLHAINVFSWPVSEAQDSPVRKLTSQGFHLRNWRRQGMTFWAISDLNDAELDEFVNLFADAEKGAGPIPVQ